MKKVTNYLFSFFLVLTTHGFLYAQDFTVVVESTDDYDHYLKPIKAGRSDSLKIRVTNNRSDTCEVILRQFDMGAYVSSWVTIDTAEKVIHSSKSKNFLVTIDVPTGTSENIYDMVLRFDAYDKNNTNHPFEYDTQHIIVDNSPPDSPTFTVSQTSKTVSVTNWGSWDSWSSIYTRADNPEDGVGGIELYNIAIILDGDTIESVAKQAMDETYHTFNQLNPNTNYVASVTAIDLAGNKSTTEEAALTAPPAPAGLTFSNITYIDATISWLVSDGATGYNVYTVNDDDSYTKKNSSPIVGTSYKIEGLNPNTKYTYAVRALSNVGPSDMSNNAEVTTLPLPIIIGSSSQCSGSYTYTIKDLVSGYTVAWSSSSNLDKQSTFGSSAIFTNISDGAGWIKAKIIAPNGRMLDLKEKYIWVGVPRTIIESFETEYIENPEVPDTFPVNSASIKLEKNTYVYINFGAKYLLDETLQWNLDFPPTNVCDVMQFGDHVTLLGRNDGSFFFTMQAENVCGAGFPAFVSITVGDDSNPFPMLLSVSPNPTSDVLSVELSEEEDVKQTEKVQKQKINVRLYNNMQIPVYTSIEYEKKFDVNVSNLPTGIYHLQVIYKEKKISKQILIQR